MIHTYSDDHTGWTDWGKRVDRGTNQIPSCTYIVYHIMYMSSISFFSLNLSLLIYHSLFLLHIHSVPDGIPSKNFKISYLNVFLIISYFSIFRKKNTRNLREKTKAWQATLIPDTASLVKQNTTLKMVFVFSLLQVIKICIQFDKDYWKFFSDSLFYMYLFNFFFYLMIINFFRVMLICTCIYA